MTSRIAIKRHTKTRSATADEQPVDLVLWWMDGVLAVYRGRGGGLPDVSVGRTGSKLGLGFRVTSEKGRQKHVEFVLDRVQVKWLHAFLAYSMPRLRTKPRGKAAARKELARLREHRRQAYPWRKLEKLGLVMGRVPKRTRQVLHAAVMT